MKPQAHRLVQDLEDLGDERDVWRQRALDYMDGMLVAVDEANALRDELVDLRRKIVTVSPISDTLRDLDVDGWG